jgi:hypothetical protein
VRLFRVTDPAGRARPRDLHNRAAADSRAAFISGSVNGARDRLLEATKRPALRLLHRTRAGEALLVRL